MSCLRYASRLYTITVRIVCTTSVASSGLPGGNPRSDVRLLCPFVYINESDALTVASCSVKIQKKERHHLDASPPELNDKNKSYVGRFISCLLYWRYYRSYSLAKYLPFLSYPNYISIYKPVSRRKSNSLRQDRPSLLWYPARKTS